MFVSWPLAKWVSLELHTDGSGACGVCVLNLLERGLSPAKASGISRFLDFVAARGQTHRVLPGQLPADISP